MSAAATKKLPPSQVDLESKKKELKELVTFLNNERGDVRALALDHLSPFLNSDDEDVQLQLMHLPVVEGVIHNAFLGSNTAVRLFPPPLPR